MPLQAPQIVLPSAATQNKSAALAPNQVSLLNTPLNRNSGTTPGRWSKFIDHSRKNVKLLPDTGSSGYFNYIGSDLRSFGARSWGHRAGWEPCESLSGWHRYLVNNISQSNQVVTPPPPPPDLVCGSQRSCYSLGLGHGLRKRSDSNEWSLFLHWF